MSLTECVQDCSQMQLAGASPTSFMSVRYAARSSSREQPPRMPSRAHASSVLMRRALHDTCRRRPALRLLQEALYPAESALGRDHGADAAEEI